MRYVSHFDALQIRTRVQVAAGKSFDLLNPNALQSAIAAPKQAVFGEEMHESVLAKASILFTRLIANHPFVDGNKRIAVEALRLFLKRNAPSVVFTDDDALDLAKSVARGAADEGAVLVWLEGRSTSAPS